MAQIALIKDLYYTYRGIRLYNKILKKSVNLSKENFLSSIDKLFSELFKLIFSSIRFNFKLNISRPILVIENLIFFNRPK